MKNTVYNIKKAYKFFFPIKVCLRYVANTQFMFYCLKGIERESDQTFEDTAIVA